VVWQIPSALQAWFDPHATQPAPLWPHAPFEPWPTPGNSHWPFKSQQPAQLATLQEPASAAVQKPCTQEPGVQAWQARPFAPHAVLSLPPWQVPDWSQHPMQFEGSQVGMVNWQDEPIPSARPIRQPTSNERKNVMADSYCSLGLRKALGLYRKRRVLGKSGPSTEGQTR